MTFDQHDWAAFPPSYLLYYSFSFLLSSLVLIDRHVYEPRLPHYSPVARGEAPEPPPPATLALFLTSSSSLSDPEAGGMSRDGRPA